MHPTKNSSRDTAGNRLRGFTLIEIMIVLVIVAIAAAFGYPSYQESVRKAKRAEARAALMNTMQQQERYYSHNNTYIAFSSATANGFKWFSGDTAAASAYEIAAAACSGDTIQNCVLLKAMPGTANVNANYRDNGCGDLTLASSGVKTAAGSAANCW